MSGTTGPIHVMPSDIGVPYANQTPTTAPNGDTIWVVTCEVCGEDFQSKDSRNASAGYANHFVEQAALDSGHQAVRLTLACGHRVSYQPKDGERVLSTGDSSYCGRHEGNRAVRAVHVLMPKQGEKIPDPEVAIEPEPVESEHTILVAFTIAATDRQAAMERLGGLINSRLVQTSAQTITSWWLAEDDRHGASDCDSAVFVVPGQQKAAAQALYDLGLTGSCNLIDHGVNESLFDGEPIGGTEKAATHRLTRIPQKRTA